jgi:hypothetical protein
MERMYVLLDGPEPDRSLDMHAADLQKKSRLELTSV